MLRFSKPKTPGFGLSADFFLSVLSSSAVLPPIANLINPAGDDGAVVGFGAPLGSNASKETLHEPLSRGYFALASKDRKTVLQMMVMGREEAGFDPEAFALSELAVGMNPELMARLRGTWTITQFRFKSHDPAVYPALQFLLSLCVRLGTLGDGVIADSISQRYLLPEDAFHPTLGDPPIDVRDVVSVKVASAPAGLVVYTLGLQKFALPEFEMQILTEASEETAIRFLYGLGQWILRGHPVDVGAKVGNPKAPFQVAEGGFDRARWEGIACYELLPPTQLSADEALATWRETTAAPF